MTHMEKTLEVAELYLSRQPIHARSASGEPLWTRNQMLRAFYAGQVAVIDEDTPPPVTLSVGIKAAQIVMGRGLVDVTTIAHEGRSGILFRPRDHHIPVGEPGELQGGEYWPVEGDVVIWIENEGGASVIDKHLQTFMPPPPTDHVVGEGSVEPMPPEEIAKLKTAIEARWAEKPWYQGGEDAMSSPGCMMRAKEILALIAAAERVPAPAELSVGLPKDVINLVIAARELWEQVMDESDESAALDIALEAFSSRVPYENDPDALEDQP